MQHVVKIITSTHCVPTLKKIEYPCFMPFIGWAETIIWPNASSDYAEIQAVIYKLRPKGSSINQGSLLSQRLIITVTISHSSNISCSLMENWVKAGNS